MHRYRQTGHGWSWDENADNDRPGPSLQPAVPLEDSPLQFENPKRLFTPIGQIRATLMNSWINLLFFFVPAGFVVKYTNRNPVTTFAVNFVAILPLGFMMSYATEELMLRLVGFQSMAVIVAFGNAVQLVVAIVALVHNQELIVRTSLIGAVISNLALMVGLGFLLGGYTRIEQSFNIVSNNTSLDFLALTVLALVIPTAYKTLITDASDEALVQISRATAVLIMLGYFMLLYWSYGTQFELNCAPSEKTRKGLWSLRKVSRKIRHKVLRKPVPAEEDQETNDVDMEPTLSKMTLFVTLLICTVLIGFCTTFAVDSIDGLTQRTALSQSFIGLILLPILGCNLDAIRFAREDYMDESLDITIGGSIQIMGFILPLAILVDWMRHDSAMTLLFDNFQVVSIVCLVILIKYMTQDGKSNWLEGVMLVAYYMIIAINAWYTPDKVLRA